MKILHLLSSLDYHSAAKEALMLVRGLAAACDLRVGVLHGEGPWAKSLRAAGLAVQSLHWTRPIDPLPVLAAARPAVRVSSRTEFMFGGCRSCGCWGWPGANSCHAALSVKRCPETGARLGSG